MSTASTLRLTHRRVRRFSVGRAVITLIVLVLSAFLIVPIIVSVIGSFSRYWGTTILSHGLTFHWYVELWTQYSRTIKYSLMIAGSAVLINTVIGTVAAYAIARSKARWMRIFEEIATLPLAIPGIAIALALIQTQSFMQTSWTFILVGHLLITLPFVIRTVSAALESGDFEALEQAAASLGASPMKRLIYVVLPNIRSALIASALMVLTISLGEFNITFFLYTPLDMTMPVGMYEAYASLRIEVGSAFTALYFLITMPLAVAMQYVGMGRTMSERGGAV